VLDTEIIAETINDILFEGTKDEIQALMDDQSLMIAWSFYRGERRGSYELRINDLWTRGLFDKDDLPKCAEYYGLRYKEECLLRK